MDGISKKSLGKIRAREHEYVYNHLKMWKAMAQKIEKNDVYLYNCSLPMYYNVESIAHNHAINAQATQVTAPRATAAALDNFAARFQKISKA